MLYKLIFAVIIFISLGGGTWAILLADRMSKTYDLNYLKTFLYYQVLKFLFGLYGIIGMVVVKWILVQVNTPIPVIQTIISFIPYLGIPFLIAAWYLFIKMAVEMLGRKISNKLSVGYFVFMLLLIFGYGYLIQYIFGVESENARLLADYAKIVFICVEVLTLLIAFYFFYLADARVKNKTFRRTVRNFANINLLLSIITISLFYFSEDYPAISLVYILVYFTGNLPAILYLEDYLSKNYLISSEKRKELGANAKFISNNQISKREWEVVEKICEGLTNREISDALFISLQTVKDHTHRIYKKTGVKNRVQLVNMISEKKTNTEVKSN